MSHPTFSPTLLLPVMLAATTAIFSFGKRKAEPAPEPEPLPRTTREPDVEPTDSDGATLPILATFSVASDAYADRDACEDVWNALSLPARPAETDEPTRFFALTAFEAAPQGRAAVAQTACKLAQDATQRGYTVLLVDADPSFPLLHTLPLFAPREGTADTKPIGFADFLRGDTSRLEPLLKLAWRTEGLLLLPAGNITSTDQSITSSATWDRMLRLAAPLAEIVLLVAPPVFAPENVVRNADILVHMNGVLVVYPSPFSAAGDTEAFEKMEAMSVPQVGAIVAPPASFTDGEVVTSTRESPADLPIAEAPVEKVEEPRMAEPEAVADEEPVIEAGSVTTEMEIVDFPAEPEPTFEPEPEPDNVTDDAEPTPPARPSFMAARVATVSERSRGNARRAVPIASIPTYTTLQGTREKTAPGNATAYAPSSDAVVPVRVSPVAYRPDVLLELLPAAGEPAQVTLRADVGGNASGPALMLEIRTRATESKRLCAKNPGTQLDSPADAPLLVLESLVSDTAPEDATTLHLVVRESGDTGAATLLEATLDTPDALRIKSGKASATGVPPVRFEVTTEPDDTARFRATVPPLGNAPALFVDLERTTTSEGRWSRVVLRLA